MKNLKLLFLIMSLSGPAFCQSNNPYTYLMLESGELIFEKIYNVDSTDEKGIEKLLLMSVPSSKDILRLVNSSDVISCKIESSAIDYRKYGGKGMSTVTYMNFPFTAGVSIVWKDNRYKVTVTDMVFNTSLGKITGAESFAKNKGSQFDVSKFTVRSGEYLEQYLSDLFKIRKSVKKDW